MLSGLTDKTPIRRKSKMAAKIPEMMMRLSNLMKIANLFHIMAVYRVSQNMTL